MNWVVSNPDREEVTVFALRFDDAINEAIKAGLSGDPHTWYVRITGP